MIFVASFFPAKADMLPALLCDQTVIAQEMKGAKILGVVNEQQIPTFRHYMIYEKGYTMVTPFNFSRVEYYETDAGGAMTIIYTKDYDPNNHCAFAVAQVNRAETLEVMNYLRGN